MNAPQANTTVVRIRRAAGHEVDGRPRYNTVSVAIPARFERDKERQRGSDGDTVTVVGSIIFMRDIDTDPGDLITIRVGVQHFDYEVADVGPQYDHNGSELWQKAKLTLQRTRGL